MPLATRLSQTSSVPLQGFEHVTAEEVFRELFERAAIGMTLVDLATRRFVWANAKLCEITQYSCEELLQRTAVDLTHPDDRLEDKTSFERFLRGEVDQRFIEKRYVRKDGTTVWVRITTTVVELAGKKCLFGVTEDISERRRVEEALHENQEHLRAALADAERAQLALQAADKRKDEFLAMLAHELRNPLASIRNSAEIMKTLPIVDGALTEVERIIERQSRHLSRLVDDLLDVARITTGKVRLRKQNLSLTDVLKRAVENVRPLFDSREHELIIQLPQEAVRVRGDELRLTQIIDNLLNNAAKYTPHNGRIAVSVRREKDEAVIQVSDNGAGIAPELLPHIFEMFEQANPTLARTEGGLGIGLTIAKSLVEMHGGHIAVRSERGRGSTFEVRLPAVNEPVEQRDTQAPSAFVGPLRILLVEDNEDASESLALLLRLKGHEVRTAADGFAALATVEDFTPDALLIDIGLPRMDGYELARQLRTRGKLAKALLLAISGYGEATDKAKSTEAGFDFHLVKPIEPETLERLLAAAKAHSPS